MVWLSLWIITGFIIAVYDAAETMLHRWRFGTDDPYAFFQPRVFLVQMIAWPITLLVMADIRSIRWFGKSLTAVDWILGRGKWDGRS
jgi:hypothetical protein